jgi:hypothetical protein
MDFGGRCGLKKFWSNFQLAAALAKNVWLPVEPARPESCYLAKSQLSKAFL